MDNRVKIAQYRDKKAVAEAMIEMASEPPDFGMCKPCDDTDKDPLASDSFRLVRTSLYCDFIQEATLHLAKCGISLDVHDRKQSDTNVDQWECPRYGDVLDFCTCK